MKRVQMALLEVGHAVGKKGVSVSVNADPVMTDPLLQQHANGVLLTAKQLSRLFGVTNMTLYHWQRKLGLPRVTLAGGKNPPIRFDEGVVLAWGQQHLKPVIFSDYKEWM